MTAMDYECDTGQPSGEGTREPGDTEALAPESEKGNSESGSDKEGDPVDPVVAIDTVQQDGRLSPRDSEDQSSVTAGQEDIPLDTAPTDSGQGILLDTAPADIGKEDIQLNIELLDTAPTNSVQEDTGILLDIVTTERERENISFDTAPANSEQEDIRLDIAQKDSIQEDGDTFKGASAQENICDQPKAVSVEVSLESLERTDSPAGFADDSLEAGDIHSEELAPSEAESTTIVKATELKLNAADKVGTENGNGLLDLEQTDDNMPGTREEETGGSVSPSLMFATCRYRWAKTVVTQSSKIVFVTLNKKVDPIRMDWDDKSECFYSDEIRIGAGHYIGNLVIDGQFYPVEDINIKHYTFEVDLYLKDDIIEDEVDKSNRTKAEETLTQQLATDKVDTYHDINTNYTGVGVRMEEQPQSESSIHISNKYEELVRSQMSHTQTSLEGELVEVQMDRAPKLDLFDVDDGRRSPVGDDGKQQYQDGDDTQLKAMDMGHVYQSESLSGLNRSLVEDDVEQQQQQQQQPESLRSSGRGTPQAAVEDVMNNGHRMPVYSSTSPVHSKHSSAHSSAHSSTRHTPVVGDPVHDFSQLQSADRTRSPATMQAASTAAQDLLFDRLDSRQSPPTSAPEARFSPAMPSPPREQIGDVLNPADRHSPIRQEYLTGTPPNSLRGSNSGSIQNSAHSSARQTPQKDLISSSLRASQEKLYGSQELKKLSGDYMNGSTHSGSLGSRPQSLSSEQELTQYYEQCSDTRRVQAAGSAGSSAQSLPAIPGTSGTPQRTGSASSLPLVGTPQQQQQQQQQRYTPDKRSMTPDNHIRVPATGAVARGPLLPNRTPPRTPASNTSSRTVTPVAMDTRSEEKIMDLENTVSTVRKLLASREQEVLDLTSQLRDVKEVNRSLQEELDHRRARSPGPQIAEWERKCNQLMDEKEILAAEVVKLQEDLEEQKNKAPSLNSYDPNNPYALQRKITELQSQIQDLQEANESAVDEISAAETKIKELAGDNESLRATQISNLRDKEDENRRLRQEMARVQEQQAYTFSEASEHRLRIEIQQIKEDNRGLRERNYQLHDDNLKLKEELADLRKSLDLLDLKRKTGYQEEKVSRTTLPYEKTAIEKEKPLDSSYHSDKGGRDYSRNSDMLDLASLDRQRDKARENEKEKDSTRFRYGRTRYEPRTPTTPPDRTYEPSRTYDQDRFSKSDSSARYDSYRSMPDGGASEKPARSMGIYDPSRTPERPSAIGPSRTQGTGNLDRTKFDQLDREELERFRHARSRTTSAEHDVKSLPISSSSYTDMGKTVPVLPERSRAIYQTISTLRSRSRSRSPADRSRRRPYCELSVDNSPVLTQSENTNRTMSSKISTYRNTSKRITSYRNTDDLSQRNAGLKERSDLLYSHPTPPTHHRPAPPTDNYREDKVFEHRAAVASGYQDDGDMSDTPTDILVSAQPLDKIPASSWRRHRKRRGSAGSDGSGSSFSDIDEQLSSNVRQRSKSADSREILRRLAPTGGSTRDASTPAKSGDRLSRTSPGTTTAGFRSITPRPIPTQHNRSTTLSLATSTMSLTHGLRPFAPRSPADIKVDDVVKFSRQGGKLSQGTVLFIGHLPGRGDVYLGVELDKEDGKHDGTFEGIRYFKCKPNKGVFVAYNKVVMAWSIY